MKNRRIELAGKFCLAVSVALLFPVLELMLPMERFAFRAWEPLLLRRSDPPLPGLFYPNVSLTLNEVGDLAPYSEQQIAHRHTWITDPFGYRNARLCDNPPVILMGDSMASGIGLDQKETISELITKETGLCTYSFGHDSPEHALKTTIRWGWHPRYAVLVMVERNFSHLTPYPVIGNHPKVRVTKFLFQEHGLGSLVALAERLRASNFYPYREKHGFWPAIQRALFPHTFVSAPPEKQRMFFFQNEEAFSRPPDNEVQAFTNLVQQYKDGLARLGMKFVVVMVPNKESVYPELIPSQRRADLLPRMYREFDLMGISYVDLFHPYRDAYTERKKIYYHLDDTHWNGEGSALAASLLKEKLVPVQ